MGKPTIAVTGAAGLVGSYLVQYLWQKGYSVVPIVRTPGKPKHFMDWLERAQSGGPKLDLRLADVTDLDALEKALQGCDVVVHTAGEVNAYGTRTRIFQTNVQGTKDVLETACRLGLQQFIHISSLSVITGQGDQFDVDESAPLRYCGENYADSKAAAEEALREYMGAGARAVSRTDSQAGAEAALKAYADIDAKTDSKIDAKAGVREEASAKAEAKARGEERAEAAAKADDAKADARSVARAAARAAFQPVTRITILRPGFIYGPHEKMWMPRLIESIKNGKAALIDGGTKETNVINVENLCRAIELCILNEKAFGQTFNLTDGEKVTKKMLFDAIADGMKIKRVTKKIPSSIARPFCEIVSGIAPFLPVATQQKLARYSRAAFRLAGVNQGFTIKKAERELGYIDRVPFTIGIEQTMKYFAQPQLTPEDRIGRNGGTGASGSYGAATGAGSETERARAGKAT